MTLATHRTTLWNVFGGQGSARDDDFPRGSTCRHGHAWIGRKAKAIGQKCKKLWENQGFLAERTGTEVFDVLPMFLGVRKVLINVGLCGQQSCGGGEFE